MFHHLSHVSLVFLILLIRLLFDSIDNSLETLMAFIKQLDFFHEICLHLVDLFCNLTIWMSDNLLDRVSDTSPAQFIRIKEALVIWENDHLHFTLLVNVLENDSTLKIHFSFILVNIADFGTRNSFICLGNDCNQEIQKNDQH